MKTIIADDVDMLVRYAADQVEALARARPEAVLGIATGSTPEPLYAELPPRSLPS